VDTEFFSCKFINIDFSKLSLEKVYFSNCDFLECTFKKAQKKEDIFESCYYKNVFWY